MLFGPDRGVYCKEEWYERCRTDNPLSFLDDR